MIFITPQKYNYFPFYFSKIRVDNTVDNHWENFLITLRISTTRYYSDIIRGYPQDYSPIKIYFSTENSQEIL